VLVFSAPAEEVESEKGNLYWRLATDRTAKNRPEDPQARCEKGQPPLSQVLSGIVRLLFGAIADQLLSGLAALEYPSSVGMPVTLERMGVACWRDIILRCDFALVVLGQFLDDGGDSRGGAAQVDQNPQRRAGPSSKNIRVESWRRCFDASVADIVSLVSTLRVRRSSIETALRGGARYKPVPRRGRNSVS